MIYGLLSPMKLILMCLLILIFLKIMTLTDACGWNLEVITLIVVIMLIIIKLDLLLWHVFIEMRSLRTPLRPSERLFFLWCSYMICSASCSKSDLRHNCWHVLFLHILINFRQIKSGSHLWKVINRDHLMLYSLIIWMICTIINILNVIWRAICVLKMPSLS